MNDAVVSPPPPGTEGGPRVLLEVFGCQMNKLDGELVAGALRKGGYDFTDADEQADVVLMVTCSIRDQAEHRVHSHLGELAKLKASRPDMVLGVLGCMASREGGDLLKRWPALDFVAGTRDFPSVSRLVDEVRADRTRIVAVDGDPRVSETRDLAVRPHKARAFITVARGCDKPCTYCVVPRTRGEEVSRSKRDILEEARALVDDGVREITLLGQTVNAWGRHEGSSLGELLYALQDLSGLDRVRFTTSHPEEMDEPLIDAMADCPKAGMFLHLPPQSGSSRMLRRMARGYTAERYREIVQQLRARIPGVELAGDIIVGFPGETDEDFELTAQLMRDVRFSQAFLFRYSPRPGTPAWGRLEDDVPDALKRERLATLMALQSSIQEARHTAMHGTRHQVLVEGRSRRDERRLFGRNLASDRIVFEGDPSLVDELVELEIVDSTPLTLVGRQLAAAASGSASRAASATSTSSAD
ncbi:MAG: tRNA-2-methylthio-N(6)-dimethylallyladenosine synthase [Planctomycetota bacterium]|nr:MAG: tRNA-2-methylthio-N(6)-dimethylallyladenosine synthase [Planctomycetota bacterium]